VRRVPRLFEHIRTAPSATRSSCCTTSTSGWAADVCDPAGEGTRRVSGCSSWKTRSRRRTTAGSRCCGSTDDADRDGELYVNQAEYLPLIQDRLIDFIRVHISDIGGLTPARKLAALCEWYGVRTAWHGPGDVSPVGHAANLALDLSSSNFGIQEYSFFGENTKQVFPGLPEVHDGAMWANDQPGLGIDIDEDLAARFPFPDHPVNGAWPEVRRVDGGVQKP